MNKIIKELNPCPFCGGSAKLIQIRDDNHKYWADGKFTIDVDHHYTCILYTFLVGHFGGGYDMKTNTYNEITEKALNYAERWNRREL